MKKLIPWITAAAFLIFIIDWGIMGLKIFDNDYDITVEAVIGIVCFIVLLACSVYKIFSNKCPHCGKQILSEGEYCPHCGKKI